MLQYLSSAAVVIGALMVKRNEPVKSKGQNQEPWKMEYYVPLLFTGEGQQKNERSYLA